MPAWPIMLDRPEAFTSTPSCWANCSVLRVPTRWIRSPKAWFEDSAAALAGLIGPKFSPGEFSSYQPWESAGLVVLENVIGSVSGGIHSGEYPLSTLVLAFMPCLTAVASTYGLNEEPTCSRAFSAMSNWQSTRSQALGFML